MSLDEARSVLWLRNNHRPLGELLDEGYLNRSRLRWAAKNAYQSRLQQAAAVLLEWLESSAETQKPAGPPRAEPLPTTINLGMTVEQARTIRWPFRPFKGRPMGGLVETRQLTFKDLGYAIDNAWDERVKQAAIVLLAVRLDQAVKEPAPPAGPLKVVSSGRSYAERRQFLWTFVQGLIFGVMLSLIVWGTMQFITGSLKFRSDKPTTELLASPAGVIALALLLAICAGGVWLVSRAMDLIFNKLDQQIENHRKGQEGEDRVVEAMRQNLDGDWTLFRNVILPGRSKADLDAVLVGPPGVWALEIKAFTGKYRNVGERWEYRAGGWKSLRSSPSRQTRNNAAYLANFFRAAGVEQWVEPVVVWANPDSPLAVENPMVSVWVLDRLPEELGNIWQGQTVEESVRARIEEKLTAMCRQKREKDAGK